jgi:uncharacterized protein YbaR (Trm112 family)
MKRRNLLLLPPALIPVPALAFRVEEAVPSLLAEYGASGCETAEAHGELVDELRRLFADRPFPAEPPPRLLALMRCPRCRCNLAEDAGFPPQGR